MSRLCTEIDGLGMEAAEEDVLAFMDVLRGHRAKLHSTNPMERLNGEIKRRTDGIRIVEQSDEWATQRARYVTLETIGIASDTALASLPIVAA